MTPDAYRLLRAAVAAAGYADDIEWSQNVKVPTSAEEFAAEVIWVILCSGMKAQVARIIQARVWNRLNAGLPVQGSVLGKSGKARAVDTIWTHRALLFREWEAAVDKVAFGLSLPWIGPITKWHVAKNLGVDCAKPDVHLERVAAHYSTTPLLLCTSLAQVSGDRVATVDYVIWRACNLGIIKSREL